MGEWAFSLAVAAAAELLHGLAGFGFNLILRSAMAAAGAGPGLHLARRIQPELLHRVVCLLLALGGQAALVGPPELPGIRGSRRPDRPL